MRVVIDENIPGLLDLLAPVATVVARAGRAISTEDLVDADALICRSQTFVNEAFLQGTGVRFVATATSGVDHIDTAWLASADIPFVSAHGSNATSVGDYVLGALALYALEHERDPRELTVGVVGAGAVGGELVSRLRAAQHTVSVSDPPLELADNQPLTQVAGAEVLTLHVPLIESGEWPTRGLISSELLAGRPAEGLIVNAARGGVVDEAAWVRQLNHGHGGCEAVVDTFDGEPRLNPQLVSRTRIATPHIAGHSLDAKVSGTRMVAQGFRQCFGIDLDLATLESNTLPQSAEPLRLSLDSPADACRAVLALYDPRSDDRHLRAVAGSAEQLPTTFDRARGAYPPRRDLCKQRLIVQGSRELADWLVALGMCIVD